MTDINETVTTVLRLDAEATPGLWDEDGIYTGLRHLGKHCSDWYYRDSDGNFIEVPRERDAALVAYYRTAAPALAREVQRLQRVGRQVQTGHDYALLAAYESGLRTGQEAMRERTEALCRARVDRYAAQVEQREPGSGGRIVADARSAEAEACADAILALEVEP